MALTFTLRHSLAMLVLLAIAVATGDARIAAVGGAASLFFFAARARAAWSKAGHGFGAANAVTAFRGGLIVLLAVLPGAGPLAALVVLGVLCLDGLDGWLARRAGSATTFGATFDMETDALLVLVAGLKLYLSGRLGPWILLPGALRYLYAVGISVVPSSRGEEPRSRLARYVFAVVVTSFVASLWPVHPLHVAFAAGATILLAVSFARSAWWSFGPRFRRPGLGDA